MSKFDEIREAPLTRGERILFWTAMVLAAAMVVDAAATVWFG